MTESRRLGRGLEALLGPITKEEAEREGSLREIPTAAIHPNPYQPRREIDDGALQELTDSIKASGLLQPVVVRPAGEGYQLIAGERRWLATQRLGWKTLPAVVRAVDDRTLLTLALIENLQRDNLSPIDEARGYQRLADEFELPMAEVARLTGRDRSTISNAVRLLKLPAEVQDMVGKGTLSAGHARTLLALTHSSAMVRLAREAITRGWSVREIEHHVRGTKGRRKAKAVKPQAASAEARRIEDALRQRLQTDVRLTARRRGRGSLTISYYSNDDLARILAVVLGEPFEG
ncbi:MAG: ParB/RepB/Spo0J family partition protein [Gemmatimonadales bacterium]|nr:ParB/RepB/Spo0J family partition protein [Gemmatimonadales bacterium]